MKTKRRTTIAPGIYRDRYGLAARVSVGTGADAQQRERRYPLGTDLAVMQRWFETTRVALRRHFVSGGRRGTLEGDGARYLRQVAHLASLKARRVEVRAWITRLGATKLRDLVTRADVLTARAAWLEAGTSPKTINNRVQTLRHWFLTLDGPDAPTPCDHVKPLPVHKTPPQFVSDALIVHVDKQLQEWERWKRLPDAKTRARFRVRAATGRRPSEIMRAQPGDVDLERRSWIVRDGKGGWSPPLYLNDDMLAAWRLFIDADAWGPFRTESFARTLRGAGWPAHVRPYNLRHTTWITAVERGVDMADVQQAAGHKDLRTTREHYTGVRQSRMQRVSESLEGRFGWTADPPAAPAPKALPFKRRRRA